MSPYGSVIGAAALQIPSSRVMPSGLDFSISRRDSPFFRLKKVNACLPPLKQKIQKQRAAQERGNGTDGQDDGHDCYPGDIICPLSKRELRHSVARKYGFQKNLKFFKKAIDKMNLT